MTNIEPFTPKKNLKAAEQVDAFIGWAKTTLPKGVPQKVHAGVRWEAFSWHGWGIRSCTFYVLGNNRFAKAVDKIPMQQPFIDFAKATIVHYRILNNKKNVTGWLMALKAMEVALVEMTGRGDVTQLNGAVCYKACEYIQANLNSSQTCYRISKFLENIVDLIKEKKLLTTPFHWSSPLFHISKGTLKQQRGDRQKKLPSQESIKALGEIFHNDLNSSLDVIITSACVFLLSQPSRVGELADLPRDCIVYKTGRDGSQRMFLRWYSKKGFGETLKPVVTGMEPSVERALSLLRPLTDDARKYAAWLEDHPDEFPPHPGLPKKGPDDPLSYDEVCAALRLAVAKGESARNRFHQNFLNKFAKRTALSPEAEAVFDAICSGLDTSEGERVYVPGTTRYHMEYTDTCVITLRSLNVLMREKYLPKNFPYTTPFEEGKPRLKYRDALFTVRTGSLFNNSQVPVAIAHPFGVELGANSARLAVQLKGASKRRSIFQRHGYPNVSVNTHAFRHELNTEMHRAGLSQLLIDAFSGRTSMGCVYNHETIEERTQALITVHPSTKQSNNGQRLEMLKTNAPLSLSDVTELDENAQDRIIHKTHLGICVHDFSYTPCPKMGACLTCGMLGCVKGDDVKLANIKQERNALKMNYEKSVDAEARGLFGASEWRKKAALDLFKCNALIETLENPERENGDIVWNSDNGWNLTNNAAAMAGLIDPQTIEAKAEEAMPSLTDLEALMEKLEG
ncbi:hypothetical protein [Halopseudomonas aestusnigri]|uniref:Integrase n=1 Tax=Halopseudomonas aestusnigri TaxID=857252 RepID=A0AAQ1JRL3_9GAMM|nr:hypothetical protein [Halopseudomonas aestusnigri]OWL84023.1 hypothetical protein B7O88_16795 [Halopseudomonas aestusnigri]SEG72289.1 hypothetical protein SAMN05216586_11818 [Halopseudomonas aestusnigri]